MYFIKIWCNNLSALEFTQMEGDHKMKCFDEDLEVIHKNVEERDRTGV